MQEIQTPDKQKHECGLSADLLEILVCPRCRAAVSPVRRPQKSPSANAPAGSTPEQWGLACAPCGVFFPIHNGIPLMLATEAVSRAEWNKSPTQAV